MVARRSSKVPPSSSLNVARAPRGTRRRRFAEQLDLCPASMRVEGTRDAWEARAGMPFPADGRYVVPGAVVPVDLAGGRGVYVEPNVWMRHPIRTSA